MEGIRKVADDGPKEQDSKQHPSMASASVLASMFFPP